MRTTAILALACLLTLPSFSIAADVGLPPGAVALPNGDVAVPISTEAPAWWTPEVQAKVDQAGALGLGYDFVADELVDVAAVYPSQVLIRPGTQILPHTPTSPSAGAQTFEAPSVGPKVPSLSWCTAAFVYGALAQGYDAISTAGHCTKVGDLVTALAEPSLLVNVGRTVSSTGSGGIGNDWAVIDVFPEWEASVDADVAWLAGPCGSVTGDASTLTSDVVKHAGHGVGIGTGGTPRVGLLEGLSASVVSFTGATQGGDSGSPVLLSLGEPIDLEACAGEGQALGILTHTSIGCLDPANLVCLKYGTRVTLVPGDLANGNLRLD